MIAVQGIIRDGRYFYTRKKLLLQKARQEEKTDSLKARYQFRPLVERKIGELVDHGARQARYIGRVKTQLQDALYRRRGKLEGVRAILLPLR